MKKKTVPKYITIEEKTAEKLKQIAEKEMRSQTSVIEYLINNYQI